MRFIDAPDTEPGQTRTEFHKLDADIQLAVEELNHTLANNGAQLVVKSCAKKVITLEVWLSN